MLAIRICWTWWLFFCVNRTFSCKQDGYTLIEEDVFNKTTIFCSNAIEDVSSNTKLLNLISKKDVVGIYRRSEITAQVCYGKALDNNAMHSGYLLWGETLHVRYVFAQLLPSIFKIRY